MIKIAINNLSLSSGYQHWGIGYYTKHLLEEFELKDGLSIQQFTNLDEVSEADIVHYPYFDLFFPTLPLYKKYPTVVTIHDVTPLVFPKHYPPGLIGRINFYRQCLSLKSVRAVITDSNSSKKDIVKFLGFPADKVFVVYLSAAKHFKIIRDREVMKKVKQRYNLPDKFAIYAGNVNWNKNLLGLTKGAIDSGMDLVMVGKSFEDKSNLDHLELHSFKEFLEKYSDNNKIHILDFVPDADLVALYNLALVTLLPSYYEGFGLTILESQACGTPVITSDVSSMPEIAGSGAVLVNPENTSDITNALLKIDNVSLKNRLVAEGIKNIERFSWKKTARETIKVYELISQG